MDKLQQQPLNQPGRASEPPVARNLVQTLPMQDGATLHLVDVRDEQKVDVQLKPGVRIAWVIRGQVEVCYGRSRFALGPAASGGRQPLVNAVALAEPDRFMRRAAPGGCEATVSLCLTPEWLDCLGETVPPAALRFAQTHLRQRQWPAAPALQTLLHGLLRPPVMTDALHALYLDGAFQVLASQALHALASSDSPTAPARPGSPRRQRQMEQVRELLDSGAADQWRLQDIARHCNMSAATLQRHFQQTFGMGVFEYQRQRRLRQAYLALQNGMAVAEAAWLAGYAHPANFSVAFRRLFGSSPQQVRNKH